MEIKVVPYNDVPVKLDHTIFVDAKRYARKQLPKKPFTGTLDKLRSEYRIKTAVDFGCGLGVDTATLLKEGIKAFGFDGRKPVSLLFPKEYYHQVDLRNGIKIKGGVDLIWCREVAEHLPFKFSDQLVRNIVRNCNVCYFTAAQPGEIGSGHINCQFPEFWIALFKRYGWEVDEELTAWNRKFHTSYLDRNNGIIFYGTKRDKIHL